LCGVVEAYFGDRTGYLTPSAGGYHGERREIKFDSQYSSRDHMGTDCTAARLRRLAGLEEALNKTHGFLDYFNVT